MLPLYLQSILCVMAFPKGWLSKDGSVFKGLLLTDFMAFQMCMNKFLILANNQVDQVSALDSSEISLSYLPLLEQSGSPKEWV